MYGLKNIEKSTVLTLKEQVAYQPGQVVSKTLAQNDVLSVTLFAFDKGEEISTHESAATLSSPASTARAASPSTACHTSCTMAESIVMPARHPHAVYGQEQFKMLLVVVF